MSESKHHSTATLSEINLTHAHTLPIAGRIARSLLKLIALLLLFLGFTPWQQNVRGIGRVVAYTPAERQQVISAPVDGRISRWLVREGSQVKQGEVIAELLDNDPLLLQRLQSEQQALLARQVAVESRVETFRTQLRMAEQARPQALAAAESRIAMAKQRRSAAGQSLDASKAAEKTANLNLNRQQQLRGKGLSSQRTLELAQLDNAQRKAERNRAQAAKEAADSEIAALNADLQKLAADTQSSVEKARAELNKALEDANYVKADLLKLETRLARQETQTITAPQTGTVLRLMANPNAELVKAGQALALFVPDTAERAVELWVDGNDLPLIVTGSHVRLQFEGYPAVQFGGWPEFSIGSFAGQVALIDASDDGKGHFRILVTPDPTDVSWPEPRFLRQGVRVNGWVLLGQVTLGYELWRMFNGFPPLVLPEPQLDRKSTLDSKSTGNGEKK
ncbi:HlyD family secretion protein [Methylomonas methanica]|uniref:Secretion protein HlyD family protein n=1 Tax=Methylomonas methanica (strain DSM 25384 / MC09) TaxID=857087 RepID=G0A5C6_METMM|nr:HlyD family efflux transporter periplasmic adaptor subunit [Methylomonas methanica]AEG01632.1 secretion protein HlyD family protein [Methylomonas methanica MC09]